MLTAEATLLPGFVVVRFAVSTELVLSVTDERAGVLLLKMVDCKLVAGIVFGRVVGVGVGELLRLVEDASPENVDDTPPNKLLDAEDSPMFEEERIFDTLFCVPVADDVTV